MIAGHLATAYIAKQKAPTGHIAFYLVASQLLDLLWLLFHYLGLEPTEPDNFMHVSLDALQVEMTYSHDVIPVLGWTVLTILIGRILFKSWRPGWAGGMLVLVHAFMDYFGAYSHHVFGPDTPNVTTGLYYVAPYLAVTVEAVLLIAVMVWAVKLEKGAGIHRGRATWITWITVFGGSTALMYLMADLSLAELTGWDDVAWMSGTTVPMLVVLYSSMIGALIWADMQPTKPATDK